jgi:toxin ParE1/3/4
MRLVVSRDADDDLLQIGRYLTERNPAAARSVAEEIDRKFWSLTYFPFMGRDRPSLGAGLRSIVAGVYVIFYRVEPDRVVIMRVLHGRRDIDAELRR